jgi:signal peptidase I
MSASSLGYTFTIMSKQTRFFVEIVKIAILALLIVTLFRTFIAQPFIVSGQSMQPAYHEGDYLIIDRLSYRFEAPKRGEVIVFHYPLDPALIFIKRIAGLPGETVDAQTGVVVPTSPQKNRSSPPLLRNLSYTAGATSTVTLASDEYYVLGDNRSESSDSREWGPLQKKFIIGRVVYKAWPL